MGTYADKRGPPPSRSGLVWGSARIEHVSRNLWIVSLCTIASRVLGMVRDMAMAAAFGAGPVLDAFTLAFRLPNLFRAVLGEGAMATAFLPALVAELEVGGKAAASRLSTAFFIVQAGLLCGLVGAGELALAAWDWAFELSPEAALLQRLTAILLPYVVLICLAAQVSTLLHATGEFLWPALLPVVMNLVWLLAIWAVARWWTDPAAQMSALSACIVLAGALQLLFPLPALWKQGYRPMGDWRSSLGRVREVFVQVTPVLLGLSVVQLNSLVSSGIAWGLSKPEGSDETIAWLGGVAYPLTAGTTSALYFAQRLYQFPLGVFGVALGTVLYPLLAAHAQRGDWSSLRADYALGLRLVAAIGLPASAGLMLLAEPLATGCFRYGRFDAAAARQTAELIATYGAGVWAYCGLLIAQRGFYALGDRQTPLTVGLWTFVVHALLSVSAVWWLGAVGLALATTASSMLQCLATAWLLQRRLGGVEWQTVAATVLRAMMATVAMTFAGSAVLLGLSTWPGLLGRALRIVVPLVISLLAYFCVAAAIGLREPWELMWRSSRWGIPVDNSSAGD